MILYLTAPEYEAYCFIMLWRTKLREPEMTIKAMAALLELSRLEAEMHK